MHPGLYIWKGTPEMLAKFMIGKFNLAYPSPQTEPLMVFTTFGWWRKCTLREVLSSLTEALQYLTCLELPN
jgi:hypothetical protein